jgi:hypothetical protein
MKQLQAWSVLLATVALVGCRAQQLRCDQDKFRSVVLEMHTNQIMDNLIRARQGLPIIQMDYIHIIGTVTHKGNTDLSGSQQAVGSLGAVITNLFGWGAGASQENQLGVTGEPVTDPEVYMAYLEFLKDPDHLRETCDPPPPGMAMLVQCREMPCANSCWGRCSVQKIYYWVPCEYRQQFFKLSLGAVALRGQATPAPLTFDVGIKGVVSGSLSGDTYSFLVQLDQEIPVDVGWMTVILHNQLFREQDQRVRVFPPPQSSINYNSAGVATTRDIQLLFPLSLFGKELPCTDIAGDLNGQKVSIRLQNHLPNGQKMSKQLEEIRSQLEMTRLEQMRQ